MRLLQRFKKVEDCLQPPSRPGARVSDTLPVLSFENTNDCKFIAEYTIYVLQRQVRKKAYGETQIHIFSDMMRPDQGVIPIEINRLIQSEPNLGLVTFHHGDPKQKFHLTFRFEVAPKPRSASRL